MFLRISVLFSTLLTVGMLAGCGDDDATVEVDGGADAFSPPRDMSLAEDGFDTSDSGRDAEDSGLDLAVAEDAFTESCDSARALESSGDTLEGAGTIGASGEAHYWAVPNSGTQWLMIESDFADDADEFAGLRFLTPDGDQLAAALEARLGTGRDPFFVVRATDWGTHCLVVEDLSETATPEFEYAVRVTLIDPSTMGLIEEDIEPNGDIASAQSAELNPSFNSLLLGTFENSTDTEIFEVTTLSDTQLLTFWRAPVGATGYGSTADAPRMRVLLADGATVYSDFSGAGEGLGWTVPVSPDSTYFLEISPTSATLGSNPTWFFEVGVSSADNQLETDDTGNDGSTGAEVAAPAFGVDFVPHSIGGTFSGTSDVDWWSVQAATGDEIQVSCVSWRAGSGVRGMTVGLYDDPATAEQTEVETENETILWGNTPDATMPRVPVTSTGTHYLSVAASTFDGAITGRYYRCGVFVYTP